MKFTVLNFMGRITLLITFHISYIRAMSVHLGSRHSQSTAGFTSSRYIDNDPNLFLSELFNDKSNSDTILRHARQVDQDIEKFNTQITNFARTLNEDSAKTLSNSSSTFNHPVSSGKFTKLESEIKKIQEEIDKMKRTQNGADSSNSRFGALDKSMETLQKLFDNKNREYLMRMENLESFMDGLTSTVVEIRREVDQINLHLLPAEIIRAIKGRDFDNAVKNIKKLSNLKKQVNYVVHEVFNNSKDNLDLVLQFAKSSRKNVLLTFLIYCALVYEIKNNNHIDQIEVAKKIFNHAYQNFEGITIEEIIKSGAENELEYLIQSYSDILVRPELIHIELSKEANEGIAAAILDVLTLGTLGLTEKHIQKYNHTTKRTTS